MSLEITDLVVAYDADPVLDGIDLSVEPGELCGLLGPNGSGKSTLLQCLADILQENAGEVRLDGDRLSDLDRIERARRVGYVPQEESSAFPTTVFETILQGRRPHGGWAPDDDDRRSVARAIERLGLEEFAMRTLDELSGGQRQKVRLARALVGDPDLLLLDEPTSSLDLKHRLDTMNLLVDYVRDARVTTVVAIHDINLATRFFDRIALLHEGEIFDVGGPDVLTPETIQTVYGVEAVVREHRGRLLVVPETAVDDTTRHAT